MEKGWLIQIRQSEDDFQYAKTLVVTRLESLHKDVKQKLDRSDYWYRTNHSLKKQHRDMKWLIDKQLTDIDKSQYHPWVPTYPFRTIPVSGLAFVWEDTWVQGKLYDLIDLPITTTTLDRCVELLSDVRGVYKDKTFRIYNIETKEEIPCEFIIEA